MPRLPQSLIAKAWKQDPFLPLLLRSCRDLESAQSELRWLKEHAIKVTNNPNPKRNSQSLLHQLCWNRSRGKPLQYILGTEYFGPLEIECKPGVLIPRPETAASVSFLVQKLHDAKSPAIPIRLSVLDLCTGTGCISLLFAHLFPLKRTKVKELKILGVDVSQEAVQLALRNQGRLSNPEMPAAQLNVEFVRADVLEKNSSPNAPGLRQFLDGRNQSQWDVIISNPPYISPKAFDRDTTRSVRNFEPKLALVPVASSESVSDQEQGDMFYPHLLEIAEQVSAKVLLVEVGDMAQAERVATMANSRGVWSGVEIWCDDPQAINGDTRRMSESVDGPVVIGAGDGRSVLCWRENGALWLGKS